MLIVVATNRPDELTSFLGPLRAMAEARVALAGDGAAALELVRAEAPDFVIVDEGLADMRPFDLVLEIMKINAMINTVAMSALSDEDFHEASEGLGILACVPLSPDEADGARLAEKLASFA